MQTLTPIGLCGLLYSLYETVFEARFSLGGIMPYWGRLFYF